MKKIAVVFLIIFTLFIFAKDVLANTDIHTVEAKRLDSRAKILALYFAQYNSPLEYNAQDFVDAADSYSLDWKLVAAISGVESTFGKFIPGGYNGWGWGVYGTQAIYFDSWRDGIYTVSKGLKENYIDKGYNDPYAMNRIYAESATWGSKVAYFMKDIEKFALERELNEGPLAKLNPEPKVAADSAILTLKVEN